MTFKVECQEMQDRYAGDLGDFSKFAIVNVLLQELPGKVGVIWYRFPNETHNNDGRHTKYVTDSRWKDCSPELVSKLREVVDSNLRTISALEHAHCLPESTRYFGEAIHSDGNRSWSRRDWFRRAMIAVEECQIVVADPDNGIAGIHHAPESSKGGKHITFEEIHALAQSHPCVILYHHFDRSASHVIQAKRLIENLQTIAPGSKVAAIRYRRVSPRAYFIVYAPTLEVQFRRAILKLTTGDWAFHFELIAH